MYRNFKIILPAIAIFVLALVGAYQLFQKRIVNTQPSPSPVALPSTQGFPTPLPEPSPTPAIPSSQPQSGSNTIDPSNIGIFLNTPSYNSKIVSPVKVTGTANVYEGLVKITVVDTNGNLLGEGSAKACMGANPCPFDISVSFSKPTTAIGYVFVFSPSPVNGTPEYLHRIPVQF